MRARGFVPVFVMAHFAIVIAACESGRDTARDSLETVKADSDLGGPDLRLEDGSDLPCPAEEPTGECGGERYCGYGRLPDCMGAGYAATHCSCWNGWWACEPVEYHCPDVPAADVADYGIVDTGIAEASEEIADVPSVPACEQVECRCSPSDAVFQATGCAHFGRISCVDGVPQYVFEDADCTIPGDCDPCGLGYWGHNVDPRKDCMPLGAWLTSPAPSSEWNPCAQTPYPRIVVALMENVGPCVLGCCSPVDGLPHWNRAVDPSSGACIE